MENSKEKDCIFFGLCYTFLIDLDLGNIAIWLAIQARHYARQMNLECSKQNGQVMTTWEYWILALILSLLITVPDVPDMIRRNAERSVKQHLGLCLTTVVNVIRVFNLSIEDTLGALSFSGANP